MRIEHRNVRFPTSFHNLGFVVPMPVLLELSIGVCACACVCMCKEGALDSLDFFVKKKHHKNQANKWDFFVVYASSKLQSRSSRLKILLRFHLGKQFSMGFLHV